MDDWVADEDIAELEAGGYDDHDELIGFENEAGVLEWIIPLSLAKQAREQGGKTKGRPRSMGRKRRGSIGRLARSVARNARAIRRIERMLKGNPMQESLTGSPSTTLDSKSIRPLAGNTLALPAPGAVGMGPWGPLEIDPGVDLFATHMTIEFSEDANANLVQQVTGLSVSTVNTLVSNNPAVPGNLFGIEGGNYGWPLGAGRTVKLSSGSSTLVQGNWSPRSTPPVAGDVTAGFLSAGTR